MADFHSKAWAQYTADYLNCILKLAADSPAELRPGDVDRVMEEAVQQRCLEEFREWLLQQELGDRTRILVKQWNIGEEN